MVESPTNHQPTGVLNTSARIEAARVSSAWPWAAEPHEANAECPVGKWMTTWDCLHDSNITHGDFCRQKLSST